MQLDNPVFEQLGTKSAGPSDDIEALLQQGMTATEAIVALQQQLREEMQVKVLAARDDMVGTGLQSALARLSEAPTNW
jgi:hypothetical protein